MVTSGKSVKGNNKIMLVIVTAGAHPIWTRDAVRNGDFWHAILSSQESREATHEDGQHQKMNFWEIISDSLRTCWNFQSPLLPSWNKIPPAATVLTFCDNGVTKERFAEDRWGNVAVVYSIFSQVGEENQGCLHENFTSGNIRWNHELAGSKDQLC